MIEMLMINDQKEDTIASKPETNGFVDAAHNAILSRPPKNRQDVEVELTYRHKYSRVGRDLRSAIWHTHTHTRLPADRIAEITDRAQKALDRRGRMSDKRFYHLSEVLLRLQGLCFGILCEDATTPTSNQH